MIEAVKRMHPNRQGVERHVLLDGCGKNKTGSGPVCLTL
jgi:hypothetical protein